MAILKMISTCHPTKKGNNATLGKCIDYALNPKKTQAGYYTGSLNCSLDSALNDMVTTKQFYGKDDSDKKSRTGYHWTISWSPEEHVDYDTARSIVKEFCEKTLKDYECVYSVHTDRAHTHCHIVFNSVNFKTGKKFRYEDGDWAKIFQPELDKLCKSRGLHTLEEDTGLSNEEYYKEQSVRQKRTGNRNNQPYGNSNKDYGQTDDEHDEKKKYKKRKGNNKYYNENKVAYTKNDFIKKDIDDAILTSHSIEEFFMLLERWGYKIRHGKSEKYGEYFALKGRGMERARRNYALGKGYGLESIKRRIELKNNPLPDIDVQVHIDMREYIVSYVYWKKPKLPYESIYAKYAGVLAYSKGILNEGKRPNYYEINKSLKDIQKIEKEIELINQYNIGDNESVEAAINDVNNEIAELDSKRKNLYIDRKPYMHLLKSYNEMKKLEMDYYAHENGIEGYKEAHDRYIELKSVLDKYGFTDADIEKYQENLKSGLKEISNEKRQLKKKIALLNNIMDMTGDIEINRQEIEDEYENIPEPDDTRKEQERQQAEEKERNHKTI